jgi:hypothetical protein
MSTKHPAKLLRHCRRVETALNGRKTIFDGKKRLFS